MNRIQCNFKILTSVMAFVLAAFVAGCGDSGGGSGSQGFPARAGNSPGLGTGVGGAGRGPAPVVMGTAANFRVLAQSAISSVPTSAITGEVGLFPAAGTFITGLTCPEVIPVPAVGYKPTSPVIAEVGTFETADCANTLKLAADPMITGAGPRPAPPTPVP